MIFVLVFGLFWSGDDLCIPLERGPYHLLAVCADMSLNREWIEGL